jgi:hypothetical protein
MKIIFKLSFCKRSLFFGIAKPIGIHFVVQLGGWAEGRRCTKIIKLVMGKLGGRTTVEKSINILKTRADPMQATPR